MIIICLQSLKKLDKNFLKIKTQFFKKEESTNELYQTFKQETTTLNNICQKIQKVHFLTHFIYLFFKWIWFKGLLQNAKCLFLIVSDSRKRGHEPCVGLGAKSRLKIWLIDTGSQPQAGGCSAGRLPPALYLQTACSLHVLRHGSLA